MTTSHRFTHTYSYLSAPRNQVGAAEKCGITYMVELALLLQRVGAEINGATRYK
jgi:hypothetical protein